MTRTGRTSVIFFVILAGVLLACSSTEEPTGGGTSSGDASSSGSSANPDPPAISVDKVSFDASACIGKGAGSEKQRCYDWAVSYSLKKAADSSPACQASIACEVAQRGCRLYVKCDAGVPPVCADLDPKTNVASAVVPFMGEDYDCTTGYALSGGTRKVLNLECLSKTFHCAYAVQ